MATPKNDQFDEIFEAAAQAYGVDPDVLKGIAYKESRFRPDIISGQTKSRVGATGLMQFMPETAKEYGINPLDPIESITGAAAYLRKSLDRFDGDYGRAVASYNWGANRKAYAQEDWIRAAPKETQDYVIGVLEQADQYKRLRPQTAPAAAKPEPEQGMLANVGDLLVGGGRRAIGAAQISPSVISGNVGPDQAKLVTDQLGIKTPQPKELKQALDSFKDEGAAFAKAEGFKESVGPVFDMIAEVGKQAVTNPKGLIYLTAESAANMVPAIVGMLAGGKLGLMGGPLAKFTVPAGALAGAFAGQAPLEIGMEFTGRIGEELQRRNLPVTESNVSALLADKQFVAQAVSDARTKGSVTAGIDAATTLGAGRFVTAPGRAAMKQARAELGDAPIEVLQKKADDILSQRTLTQKVARGAGAVGIGVAGGGASEAGGQYAAYGEVDLAEVGPEMLGELGGSIIEIPAAARALTERRATGPTGNVTTPTAAPVSSGNVTTEDGATPVITEQDIAATGVQIPKGFMPVLQRSIVGKTREQIEEDVAVSEELQQEVEANETPRARLINALLRPERTIERPPVEPSVGVPVQPTATDTAVPQAPQPQRVVSGEGDTGVRTEPAGPTTPAVKYQGKTKQEWIDAVISRNRVMEAGAPTISVTEEGGINFNGDPFTSPAGRGLYNTYETAIRAGATQQEIAEALRKSQEAKPLTPPAETPHAPEAPQAVQTETQGTQAPVDVQAPTEAVTDAGTKGGLPATGAAAPAVEAPRVTPQTSWDQMTPENKEVMATRAGFQQIPAVNASRKPWDQLTEPQRKKITGVMAIEPTPVSELPEATAEQDQQPIPDPDMREEERDLRSMERQRNRLASTSPNLRSILNGTLTPSEVRDIGPDLSLRPLQARAGTTGSDLSTPVANGNLNEFLPYNLRFGEGYTTDPSLVGVAVEEIKRKLRERRHLTYYTENEISKLDRSIDDLMRDMREHLDLRETNLLIQEAIDEQRRIDESPEVAPTQSTAGVAETAPRVAEPEITVEEEARLEREAIQAESREAAIRREEELNERERQALEERKALEAERLELEAATEAKLQEDAARAEAAEKAEAKAKQDAEKAAKKEQERKEIEQASEAASRDFQLGQSAEDNLSGQKGIFENIEPTTIEVDGVQRPTTNSEGQPIAATPLALRNFWRWFGESVVVDENDRPLVMYHGTRGDFDTFDIEMFGRTDQGWAGKAFYFAPSPEEASQYATFITQYQEGAGDPNVMPVYLRSTNALEWELGTPESQRIQEKRNTLGPKEFAEWVREQGYDAVHITSRGGENQWAVLSNTQIKSVFNRGTYGDTGNILENLERPNSAVLMFDQAEVEKLRTPAYKGRERLNEMRIDDFLALADAVAGNNNALDREKVAKTTRIMRDGGKFNSLPFLQFDRDGQVTGHEGRHRAMALKKLGYETMPVVMWSANIRWDQQDNPDRFDYVEEWPTVLKAQSKAADPNFTIPFPVPRSAAATPYEPLANLRLFENVALTRGPSVYGEAKRSPSFKREVEQLQKRLDKGEITADEFASRVEMALKAADDARMAKDPKPRERGADYIRQRLLEAKRRGDLSDRAVDMAEWFILKNPALVDDLAVSIKGTKGDTSGNYDSLRRLMTLMKESSADGTTVHEILHHLERMMPAKVQDKIRQDWLSKLMKADPKSDQDKLFFYALKQYHLEDMVLSINNVPKELFKAYEQALKEIGNKAAVRGDTLARHLLTTGRVAYDNYQYTNPSEFWAVNATRIAERRFEASSSVLGSIKNWLREFAQKARDLFGLPSDATLIRALDSLIKGDGKFKSQEMLMPGSSYENINIHGHPVNGTWDMPGQKTLVGTLMRDDFIYRMQDKLIDMRRAVNAIKQGKPLPANLDPDLQETLFAGAAADATMEFATKELRPLTDEMRSLGVSNDELGVYLHNRHAEEANKVIAARNPSMPDGGSGIKTADARAYLAGLSPQKKANLDKVAQKVDAILEGTRQLLVDSKLETNETVDAWRSMFQHYIPLNREDADYSLKKPGTSGAGYQVVKGATRSRTGSMTEVNHGNILARIADQRELTIVRAEKTKVGRAIYGLALKAPNPKFWMAIDPAMEPLRKAEETRYTIALFQDVADSLDPQTDQDVIDMYEAEIKRLRKVLNKQMSDAADGYDKLLTDMNAIGLTQADLDNLMRPPVKPRYDAKNKRVVYEANDAFNNKHALGVRVNGNDRYVLFNGNDPTAKRMVESLKQMDADALGPAMSMVAQVTRYFAAINTQYNPVFGPYNFLRDVQTALLQLSTTPIAGKKAAVMKHILNGKAMAAIYRSARARTKGRLTTAQSDYDIAWREMQSIGGQTGFRDQFSQTEERADAIRRMIDPSSWAETPLGKVFTANGTLKVPMEVARQAALPVFEWLSDYNTTFENAVRLGAFMEAKKYFLDQGLSNLEAIQKAGGIAKDITVNFNRKGQVANQVGALYAFFNASVQGTAKMIETYAGPAGKAIIGGSLLLGSLQAVSLALSGFGEDEPPEFIKQRNIIIPYGDKQYFAFPMPLGFNFLPNVSRILTEVGMDIGNDKKVDYAKKIGQLADIFFDMFNPIGNAGLSLQTISPTVTDPLAGLAENKDWTGKPIAREDRDTLNPTPGYTRAKENASALNKELAKFLNQASGGTLDTKGLLSPTPDQLDYLMGQLTGGVGREAMKTAKLIEAQRTGEEIKTYNIPLYGRFFGDIKSTANVSNRFYENITKMNEMEASVKGRMARREDVQGFIAKNPEARLYPMADKVYKNVSELRKLRRELVDRGAPKERIKAVEERITKTMQQFNDRLEQAEKR